MKWLYNILYWLAWPFVTIFHPRKVIGRENIPEDGGLVCSNHTSYSDPLLVVFSFGVKYQLHYMAKSELFKVPVLGYLLKKAGIFPVERGKSDVQAIKTALRLLKQNKFIGLFPEGTRIRGKEDASAKTGAAMLAARSGANIIPVYTQVYRPPFKRVKVIIGKPYKLNLEGKPTQADYARISEEIMRKVYGLAPEDAKK